MITWLAVIAFLMCFERSDPEICSCRGLVRATGFGVVGRLGTLTGVVESLPRGATNDFLSQRTASQLRERGATVRHALCRGHSTYALFSRARCRCTCPARSHGGKFIFRIFVVLVVVDDYFCFDVLDLFARYVGPSVALVRCGDPGRGSRANVEYRPLAFFRRGTRARSLRRLRWRRYVRLRRPWRYLRSWGLL